jgi:PAS domain S-box-containing protein
MSANGNAIDHFDACADRATTTVRAGYPTSPELLRRIVDQASVMMAVVNGEDHRIVLANAAFRAVLPAGRRGVRGRRIQDVLPPAVARGAVRVLDEVLATGRPLRLREFGASVDAKDTWRYWDANLTPLRHDSGPIEAILVTASDVTARVVARRQAERMAAEAQRRADEAEESRRMLDALMAYIPEGIAVADAHEMRVRRVSYHGLAMTKRPWQEILDQTPPERVPEQWQFYHPDGRTLAGTDEFPLSRAARHGEIVINEQWLLRQHDGRLLPVLCNAGPIRDLRGEVTGGVMSWLDISSLEDSRRRLLDTSRRFELAIEAGNLGVWDYNAMTGAFVWSDRAKSIFGLRADADVGYALFLGAVHPDDRPSTNSAIQKALDPRGDGTYVAEFRIVRPDGSERWIAARGNAFFEGQGSDRQAVRLVGIVRDITEHVQAVREQESLLLQKDMLIKEVHHRVNNSLQLISSLLRLQSMTQPSETRRLLDETRARVQTVARIHQRLYQSDRLAVVDVASYLRALCADLATSLGRSYDARLRFAIEPLDVPTEVAVSLGLIVNELVINAFKYAYDGAHDGIIDVCLARAGDGYELVVRDQGPGLPPGFDAENSPGLGMRVVRSLVDRLDAQLECSSPGPGAWFRIRIPFAAAAVPAGPAAATSQ